MFSVCSWERFKTLYYHAMTSLRRKTMLKKLWGKGSVHSTSLDSSVKKRPSSFHACVDCNRPPLARQATYHFRLVICRSGRIGKHFVVSSWCMVLYLLHFSVTLFSILRLQVVSLQWSWSYNTTLDAFSNSRSHCFGSSRVGSVRDWLWNTVSWTKASMLDNSIATDLIWQRAWR